MGAVTLLLDELLLLTHLSTANQSQTPLPCAGSHPVRLYLHVFIRSEDGLIYSQELGRSTAHAAASQAVMKHISS